MPERAHSGGDRWRVEREVLRSRFWQLAGYEAVFKFVSIALFAPLAAFLLRRVLAWSGSNAVSNYELSAFFLSPPGATLIVVGATLAFAILYLEQAGLIIISVARLGGQSVSFHRLLRFAAARFSELLLLGLRQFGFYVLAALPFLAVAGGACALFLRGGDINYFLQVKPPAFWWAAGVTGIAVAGYAVVGLRLFVFWLFSVPVLLFERIRPAEALRRSSELVKGRFSGVRSALLRWLLSVIALSAAVAVALAALQWLLTLLAGDRAALALGLTALALAVKFVAAVAMGFVVTTTFCVLVARLYSEAVESVELPQSLLAADRDEKDKSGVPLRLVTGGSAVALLILTGVVSYRVLGGIELDNSVQVTAHRGSSVVAPENSMSAVKQAIADRADYVEIDVQETADGVIVMLHDKDLKRVAGVDRGIWEVNYAELKDLDTGSWFSSEFAGERIATLNQVIEVVRGKARLNIELKFNGHDKQLAEQVCRIVTEAGYSDQCVISSLEYRGLHTVREFDGALKTGLIVTASIGDVTELEGDFLSVNAGAVTRDLIARAHKAGKEVHVWTVNEPWRMNTMIHLGVDNVITDVPDVLVELIDERAKLSQPKKIFLWLGDLLNGRL